MHILRAVASRIWECRSEGRFLDYEENKTMLSAVQTLDDANTVHQCLMEMDGRRRVGWKVGFNNPEGSYAKVGLSEPFTAPLMSDVTHEPGAVLTTPFLTNNTAGIAEAEWAFVMAKDVDGKAAATLTLEELVAHVETVGIAIELAATCVAGGAAVPVLNKIADHGLCSGVVFRPLCPASELFTGPEALAALASKGVSLSVNGKAAPPTTLDGLVELHRSVRLVSGKGMQVKAGDVIITGAVAKVLGLKAGDKVEAIFSDPIGMQKKEWKTTTTKVIANEVECNSSLTYTPPHPCFTARKEGYAADATRIQ